MLATLKLHSKRVLRNGIVIEMKVWEVPTGSHYPEGFKYSLIAVDPKNRSRVLMDNHRPKGHHYHLDEEEFSYSFSGLDRLIVDFTQLVREHLG